MSYDTLARDHGYCGHICDADGEYHGHVCTHPTGHNDGGLVIHQSIQIHPLSPVGQINGSWTDDGRTFPELSTLDLSCPLAVVPDHVLPQLNERLNAIGETLDELIADYDARSRNNPVADVFQFYLALTEGRDDTRSTEDSLINALELLSVAVSRLAT